MAFPVIAGVTSGLVTSNSTSWTLTWPSGMAAGDLVIWIVANDGSATANTTSLTGDINDTRDGAGLACRAGIGKYVATGSESGNFTVTLSASEQGCWMVLHITGWQGTLGTDWNGAGSGAVEGDTGDTTGTGTAPDCDSLDPTNWATEDTLWLAIAFCDHGNTTFTAKDANYTYVTGSPQESGGAGGTSLAVAYRNNAVSSEDPGAFTVDASEQWGSITVGIQPATATPFAPPFTRREPKLHLPRRDFDPWSVKGWR